MPENVPCLLPPPKPGLTRKPKNPKPKPKADESDAGSSFQDTLRKVKKARPVKAEETRETKNSDTSAKISKVRTTIASKAGRTEVPKDAKNASGRDETSDGQNPTPQDAREQHLPPDHDPKKDGPPRKDESEAKPGLVKPDDSKPRPAAVVQITPQPKQASPPNRSKADEVAKQPEALTGPKQRNANAVVREKGQARSERGRGEAAAAPGSPAKRQAATDAEMNPEMSDPQQADSDRLPPDVRRSKPLAIQPRQTESNDATSQAAPNPSTAAADVSGSQSNPISDDAAIAADARPMIDVVATPRDPATVNLAPSDAAAMPQQPVSPGHAASDSPRKPDTQISLAQPAEAQFVEANHHRIITGISGQLLPNGGSMHIRLDPPELGALHVRVEMRDGVMTAAFETSSDEATKVLSHSLGDLKTALEAQGVSVEKLHVRQAPREQSSSGDNSRGERDDAHQEQAARQEQQRKEMLRRMWRRLTNGQDPLDLVA